MQKEKKEAERRRRTYLGNRLTVQAKERSAIIVDDGLATGLSMLAAIEEIKKERPKK